MRETNSTSSFSTASALIVPRRHGEGQVADLVVIEQLPDLGPVLLAKREQQHGGTLQAREPCAGLGRRPAECRRGDPSGDDRSARMRRGMAQLWSHLRLEIH